MASLGAALGRSGCADGDSRQDRRRGRAVDHRDGASWLVYFRALQAAPASWVAPIDKLSLPLTIVLAAVWLHEPMNWQVLVGVAMITAGSFIVWYRSASA